MKCGRVMSLLKYQISMVDPEKKYFPAMENWCKLIALAGREIGQTYYGNCP